MVNKTLNILIVASWYPDEKHPTNGSFIEEQAQMLKKAGHKVVVLHPFLTGTFFSTFLKKDIFSFFQWNDISVLRVGIKPLLPGQREIAYKKLYRACKKELKRNQISIEQFDVIHSHAMFMGGYIAMNLAIDFNKIFFHTEHTSGLIFHPEQYNSSDIQAIRKLFETAKNVFFVSQFALDKSIEQFGIEKSPKQIVLWNLVEQSFFSESLNQEKDLNFSYIVIANLIPRKQIDLIIKSFSELLKIYPNSQLTIAGDGPEKMKLVSLVNDLKLSEVVCFLPKLNRQKVREQIAKHNVLISASQVETFGLTVAEAQALGKPAVVTDSGGVRDIVEDKTGIITEQGIEEFSNGLTNIRANYDKYDPLIIREITFNKFSSNVIYNKLMTFYASVLN